MLDYHLHLWPHGTPDHEPTLDELASYCEKAQRAGVVEIALTEHFFRFTQARSILGGYFMKKPESSTREYMQEYWDSHAKADLDVYVERVLEAKAAGLPVVLGLEVDYYEDHMEAVSELLAGYPFDVLLGSVHWIVDWPFDHLESPEIMAEWDKVGVEPAWEAYTRSIEELAATRSFDVLAHPDLIKIAGHRPSVPEEYYHRIAEAAHHSGIAAEVSSAGLRKPVAEAYPAPSLLKLFRERGVPVTTASDSHGIRDVAYRFSDIREQLELAGYDSLLAFHGREGASMSLPTLSR